MTRRDRFAAARAVADAVLYEGYVLYPYRASARKNQLRWQFGVLAPRRYADAAGFERGRVRTECVVEPGDRPELSVRIRFLHVQRRIIEAAAPTGGFEPADALLVDGAVVVPWDEAVEREVEVDGIRLLPLSGGERRQGFHIEAGRDVEVVRAANGAIVGRAIRTCERLEGHVTVTTAWGGGQGALLKVAVEVENGSEWHEPDASRDDVLRRSLVAVHTLLAVDDGLFVSSLDPPDHARHAVRACANDGTYPVLVGDDGPSAGVVLSSPIILYDHPVVAPESVGDLYDATEIDEILALRVLTLTDEEKAEARGTDRRAAAIVDRCDDMPPEMWARLHGAVRSLQPAAPAAPAPEPTPWWEPGADASVDPGTDTVWIGAVEVGRGTHVRLRPSRRADAQDVFLAGLTATVAGIFNDVDGEQHVAVTVDDDPAGDELAWQGRYLYFHPDELEVLG